MKLNAMSPKQIKMQAKSNARKSDQAREDKLTSTLAYFGITAEQVADVFAPKVDEDGNILSVCNGFSEEFLAPLNEAVKTLGIDLPEFQINYWPKGTVFYKKKRKSDRGNGFLAYDVALMGYIGDLDVAEVPLQDEDFFTKYPQTNKGGNGFRAAFVRNDEDILRTRQIVLHNGLSNTKFDLVFFNWNVNTLRAAQPMVESMGFESRELLRKLTEFVKNLNDLASIYVNAQKKAKVAKEDVIYVRWVDYPSTNKMPHRSSICGNNRFELVNFTEDNFVEVFVEEAIHENGEATTEEQMANAELEGRKHFDAIFKSLSEYSKATATKGLTVKPKPSKPAKKDVKPSATA